MPKPAAYFPFNVLPNLQELAQVSDIDVLGITGSITQKADQVLTSGYASSGAIAITITGAFTTWPAFGVVENLTTLEQMVFSRTTNDTLNIASSGRAKNGTAAAAGSAAQSLRFHEMRGLGRLHAQIQAELVAHDEFLRSGIGINLAGNSSLDVFQRGGVGSAVTMANASFDGPDRFWSLVAGTAPTVQQQTAPTGFTAPNVARIVSGGTSHRAALCQALEFRDVKRFRGWPATASVRVRASKNAGSGSINVRFVVLEWTGTTDAPTKSLVNNWASGVYTPGNFFIAGSYTVIGGGVVAVAHNTVERITIDLSIGASANNLVLMTWLQDAPAHASDYIEVGEFRLSPGRIAPPSWQPRLFDETAHLQRFNHRIAAGASAIYTGPARIESSNTAYVMVTLPVPMRKTPVITTLDNASVGAYDGASSNAVITTNFFNNGGPTGLIFITGSSVWNAHRAAYSFVNANKWVNFDAEF